LRKKLRASKEHREQSRQYWAAIELKQEESSRRWREWRAGTPKKTIANWLKIRKEVVDRDGYECRICHRYEGEVPLHVHHKDWDRSNNQQQNLVTLCQPCHMQVHNEGYKPSLYPEHPEPWATDIDDPCGGVDNVNVWYVSQDQVEYAKIR